MTAQEYRLQPTASATQGAAVFMALIAVIALGLMGFAMGYAKAGQSAFAGHARYAAMPGVEAARVSLVTDREGEVTLAPAEVPAPAKPLSRPVAMITAAPAAKPAAEPMDSTPNPQVEPAAAPEAAPVSEPV